MKRSKCQLGLKYNLEGKPLLNCIYPKIFSIIQSWQLSNILTNTISPQQRFVIGAEIDKTRNGNLKSSSKAQNKHQMVLKSIITS